MCIAQHCLDRVLGYGRGDTFLCRPVPLVEHPSSLPSAAKGSQLTKEIVSVVPMPGHRLSVDHRRLALEGKIQVAWVLPSVSRGVLRGVL